MPVIQVESDARPNFRSECRAAIRDPASLVSALHAGSVPHYDFMSIVRSLRDGSSRCPERPELAFSLLNQGIGSPVRFDWAIYEVETYLEWAPSDLSTERREEVTALAFLAGSTYVPPIFCGNGRYHETIPEGLTEATLRQWLIKPEYWEPMQARFGDNLVRDRLILREMINPASPYFNRAGAAEMVPGYYDARLNVASNLMRLEVASALVDLRFGEPSYEAAAELLIWFSPYHEWGAPEEARQEAQAIWVRINQVRLTDPDPQLRLNAAMALATGDPTAMAGRPFEDTLGQDAQVTVLDAWPEGLEPLQYFDRFVERVSYRYPSRGLRGGLTGRVELGLLFNPDGSFRSIHVTRSAGVHLDRGTIRSVERYLRPRPVQMRLTGFEGQYVYVPLPSFEYRLGRRNGQLFTGDGLQSGFDGETITVVPQSR